jgi:hypothetical protein
VIEPPAGGVVVWLLSGGRGASHAAERSAQLVAASYAILVAYNGKGPPSRALSDLRETDLAFVRFTGKTLG